MRAIFVDFPDDRRIPDRSAALCQSLRWLAMAFFWLAMTTTPASETHPTILTDGMVLQRETAVPIWGWDAPGTEVRVGFRGAEATATADADGRWQCSLASGAAGGPFTMEVTGSASRTIDDVLVGEVWIAGGQSNMWWALRNTKGGEEAIAAADDPHLRCFNVPAQWADEEQRTNPGVRWETATGKHMRDWPGLAYGFAQRLRQELGVPVGIVHVAVPGKQIQTFMSRDLLQDEFWQVLAAHEKMMRELGESREQHARDVAAWRQAGSEGKEPQEPKAPQQVAGLWNGTVAPCAPHAARGFIWWQGEANVSQPRFYESLFPGLIVDWRHRFTVAPAAPFYFGELHGAWEQPNPGISRAPWPRFREAQQTATRLPGVYAINANDLQDPQEDGWPNQIHPWDKFTAGERMARRALVEVYGQEASVWASPRVVDHRLVDGAYELTVDQAGAGLRLSEGEEATGFVIAGSDRTWYPAQVELDGNRIRVSSPQVSEPVAVRHAWANYPQVNVVNEIGLPLATWRSDAWRE